MGRNGAERSSSSYGVDTVVPELVMRTVYVRVYKAMEKCVIYGDDDFAELSSTKHSTTSQGR